MIDFDEYGRNAHLKPGLIAVLPVTMALLAWMGTGSPIEKALAAVVATSGGTFVLAMLARNKGRAIQDELWKTWGGSPTVQLLRHRGPTNPELVERWHENLKKLTGKKLPIAQEEAADPLAADIKYDAAIGVLKVLRNDPKKYRMIFRENVHYGFCRNLLGLRSLGITCSLLGITATGIATLSTDPKLRMLAAACCFVNLGLLVVWVLLINRDWVKQPAFAYAQRLLESSEIATSRKGRSADV